MVQWLLSNFQNFLFQIEKLLSQKAKLLNFFIHIINRAIKNCFGPDCAAKFVQWQWMNYSSKQRQPSRVFSLSIYLDVYAASLKIIEFQNTQKEHRLLRSNSKLSSIFHILWEILDKYLFDLLKKARLFQKRNIFFFKVTNDLTF